MAEMPKNNRSKRSAAIKGSPALPSPYSLVSECTKDYAKVVNNPFDAKPSCVPWMPALDSGKYKVFVRGVLEKDPASGGHLSVCARPEIGNASPDNVWASNATYSDSRLLTSGSMVTNYPFNGPFAASDFGNGVRVRLASIGLRVRYVGAQLDMGGTVVGLVHPDRGTLSGMDTTALLSFDRTIRKPVSRQWTELRAAGFFASDFDFAVTDKPWGSSHFLGFLIQYNGSDPSFEFEFYANYEAVGSMVRDKTPSFSDPVGTPTVTRNSETLDFQQGKTKTAERLCTDGNAYMQGLYSLGAAMTGSVLTETARRAVVNNQLRSYGLP